MKINYFILFFLFSFLLKTTSLLAQTPYVWQDKDSDKIESFEILLDKNYTFEQILNDSSLVFQENPKKYKFEKEEYCWFRFSIQNNSVYTKEGYCLVVPHIDNILYFYDFENKKWDTIQAGISIINFNRENVFFPILLQAKKTNTFYIKSKVKEFHSQNYPVQLIINTYPKIPFEKNEQFIINAWLIVVVAMLLFFLYNLYIYILLKEKTYLYYLIIILGSILYISFFSEIANFISPFKFYNLEIQPNGLLYFYHVTDIIQYVSVWSILFGYIQFTRNYLQLSIYFPFWDKVLKYTLYILSVFYIVVFSVSFIQTFFIHHWLALFSNILSCIVILLMIYIGIHSYRKGHKIGYYFLLANTVPLFFMICIAFYLTINQIDTKTIQLLPHLALLSQTLTFAIALVARINLLKDELKEKQFKAQQLEKENGQILARNRYIELENEYIMADMVEAVNKEADLQQQMKLEANQKTKIERNLQQKIDLEIKQKADLQAKLEANQRELTANALYLYQKNEMLSTLQKQIENLSYKDTTTHNREGLREIKSTIKNDFYLENDWDKFKLHFEEVHPNFFKDLKENYPTLTPNEIRLSAYYHLNMSVKEIATLLNINPRSVHKAKSRLNKKMGKAEDLEED